MDAANMQKNSMLYQIELERDLIIKQREFYKNLIIKLIDGLDLYRDQPEFKFNLTDINVNAR